MLRALYRFYLYAVSIALLIFIVVALSRLLTTLLAFTPLRGKYGPIPDRAEVVQSIFFAIIALVIGGGLVGLHYWLIRRDIDGDPAAGMSGIRSFFLNITEGIGVLLAVPLIGFFVIGNFTQPSGAYVVVPAAIAIPTLALVGLLEVERRRIRVNGGVALAFQRVHLYSVQIVLLIFLAVAWFSDVKPLVDGVFFGGNATKESCKYYCTYYYSVFALAASLLWFLAAWLAYGWMVKDDDPSLLRLVLHYLQFTAGLVFVIAGLYLGVEVILLFFFQQVVALKDVLGPYAPYDFVSPLTLGIVVVITYNVLLQLAVQQGLIERRVQFLTECTIVAILAAGAFWWGGGTLLYNTFQVLAHTAELPDSHAWVSGIALMVVGAGYVGLDVYLSQRRKVEPVQAAGPRRGLVFALLGGGILAFAIGGVTALYAWVTALFGSPLNNGQVIINLGLAAFIVGVFLVGIYLWASLREQLFSNLVEHPTVEAKSMVAVEGILDDLLANKITRDEAVARIRALGHS
jgi:Domain of unknown function (DUF5671)